MSVDTPCAAMVSLNGQKDRQVRSLSYMRKGNKFYSEEPQIFDQLLTERPKMLKPHWTTALSSLKGLLSLRTNSRRKRTRPVSALLLPAHHTTPPRNKWINAGDNCSFEPSKTNCHTLCVSSASSKTSREQNQLGTFVSTFVATSKFST